jgi:pyruvate/2-oxoglutarate dehydrogenase complex dihydrolipoamide acyltransferase (E2) component
LPTPKPEETSSTPPSSTRPPPDPAQPEPASAKSNSGKQPKHSRPFFPSVHRLLLENDISNLEKINGSGIRGMLTKGDVLSFLGQASSPTGTYKEAEKKESVVESKKPEPKVFFYIFVVRQGVKNYVIEQPEPLDGPAIRRLIISNLLRSSVQVQPAGKSISSLRGTTSLADPSFIRTNTII